MAQTSNYGLGKPDANTTVAEEIERLIATWDQVDLILKTLADVIATKAAANHNQAIGTITGLTEALAGKMAASKTFAVADLTDVSGSVEAALGYVLAKTALGFSFQSAASLLGNHQHGVADIVGLTAAIDAKIAALVAASPATLDTLAELATALGNDPNFATTMASQIADAARLTTGTVADARLPERLKPECKGITDWNSVTANGWWMAENAPNAPTPGHWYYGQTIVHNGDWVEQRVVRFTETEFDARPTYKRWRLGGMWGSWQRVYDTAAEIQSIVPAKSGSAAVVSLTGATSTEVLNLPANIRVLNVDMILQVGGNQGYQSLLQLGTSASYASSGYQNSELGVYPNSITTGIDIGSGAESFNMPIAVRAVRLTGNLWAYSVDMPNKASLGGTVTLGAELTRLKYNKTAGAAPIANSQMKVSWEF